MSGYGESGPSLITSLNLFHADSISGESEDIECLFFNVEISDFNASIYAITSTYRTKPPISSSRQSIPFSLM